MRAFSPFLTFELTRPKSAGSFEELGLETRTVTGRVLDSEGQPIVGVFVALLEEIGFSQDCYDENFDVTDSLGRFFVQAELDHTRIVARRTDKSTWQASVAGRDSVDVHWPAVSSIQLSVDPKLTAGETALSLRSTGYWVGMTALRRTFDLDAKHTATLENVLPGEYYVMAKKHVDGAEKEVEIAKIVVEEGREHQVRLEGKGQVITGRLSEMPPAIRIERLKRHYRDLPVTADFFACAPDGSFQSRPLGPGEYVLHVSNVPYKIRVLVTKNEGVVISDIDMGTSLQQSIWETLDMKQVGRWSIENERITRLLSHKETAAVTAELLRIVKDGKSPYSWKENEITALGKMTDRAGVLDNLLLLMTVDEDDMQTSQIIRALENSKQANEKIIRTVSQFRNHSNHRIRWASYYTMRKLAEADASSRELAIPLMIDMLDDPWYRIRADVAGTLGFLQAEEALPALAITKKDRIGQVRVWAAWAVWKISGESQPAIALMTSHLYSTNYSGKWEAAYLLDSFEELPPLTVTALLEASNYEVKPPYVGVVFERNRIKRSAISTLKKRAPNALEK